jgi:Fe-S cluster assembly protein SufD
MATRTTTDTFVTAFARLEGDLTRGSPAWLGASRRSALAHFAERGLPTTRDEAWKYTSIAPIEETDFDLGPPEAPAVSADVLAPFLPEAGETPAWSRLVFVNGRYSARLSAVGPLPRGVHVGSLGEAMSHNGRGLRAHLVSEDPELADPWSALNAAFWRDGALVSVPAGVVVESPIHLLFVTVTRDAAPVIQPRSLIVLDRASQATVIETYAAVSAETYLTNATTRCILGAGASLDHHRVQQESERAFHVGATDARQARDSGFASTSIVLGGRLVRNDVRVRLEAEGATSTLHGLYVIGGRQHVDTHTTVDHAAPHGTSRQLYKGVLDGRARGVFDGRIIVRRGAQKTDAHQTNKNLLLSDGVEVDSKPQLEIFADDVKCSHGAADGQLADEALFYLRSRGLGEDTARALLTYGFASEVVSRIPIDALRVRLEALLTARLQGGRITAEEPA